jgi:hypothetical protein
MSQIVEPDRRQARLAHQQTEMLADVARPQRPTILAGEDQARVLPRAAPRHPLLELLLSPRLQQGNDGSRQRDRPGAGLRLRVIRVRVIAWPGLPDREQAVVEVGLRSGQAGHLGAAQPGERSQVVQRIQPVALGRFEELAGLLRGPHHHRPGFHLPPLSRERATRSAVHTIGLRFGTRISMPAAGFTFSALQSFSAARSTAVTRWMVVSVSGDLIAYIENLPAVPS